MPELYEQTVYFAALATVLILAAVILLAVNAYKQLLKRHLELVTLLAIQNLTPTELNRIRDAIHDLKKLGHLAHDHDESALGRNANKTADRLNFILIKRGAA